MTLSTLAPFALVLLAGAMIALQAPANVMLSRAGGSPVLAALISFGVGTLALFAAWLASGHRPALSPFASLPWFAWVGGVYGAIYVGIAAYAAPRIGLASLITVGIAGQLAMAMWLDHHGAFGLPRAPLEPARVVGALLVVVGVVLVRRA